MSPLDRLIKTRQQERDDATSAVSSARAQLERLETAERELMEDAKQRIAAGAEDDSLTAATLEQLDLAGRFAHHATRAGEEAMETAREQAMEVHRALRLLEILRDRIRERERAAERSRERRELDEVAARKSVRGDAFKAGSLLVAALALFPSQGCNTEASAEEVTPAAAASVATPAKTRIETPARCPEDVYSEAELVLLRKLRKRHQILAEQEKELNLREARVLAAESKVVVLMEQLRMLQGSLGGDKRPVAVKAANEQEDASGTAPVDLVGVLKGMNRRAASAMLAQMDPRMVASAMVKLSPEEVARLLAMMPPENAALVGAHLAVKRRPKRAAAPAPETAPETVPAATPAATPAAAPVRPRKKRKIRRARRAAKEVPTTAPTTKKKDWTPVKPPAKAPAATTAPAAKPAKEENKKPTPKKPVPAATSKPVAKDANKDKKAKGGASKDN